MPHKFSLSHVFLLSGDEKPEKAVVPTNDVPDSVATVSTPYRLYKRRFVGLFGMFVLNIIIAMGGTWFGPIAIDTSVVFGISLNQVNWLSTVISFVYLPFTILTPWIVSNYGVRRCCEIIAITLAISGWVRYAAVAPALSSGGAYALLMIGQLFSGVSQSIIQVLVTKYSEDWFDQSGRTTATMILAISNPIGAAIGQIASPYIGDVKKSLLILAGVSTAGLPMMFLIGNKPPTPPTAAAAAHHEARSFVSLVLAIFGKSRKNEEFTPMTGRQKYDFIFIMVGFGVNMGIMNSFSSLSSQVLVPYGYAETTAGLMASTILIAGVVSALITAPLFDRIFTMRMGLAVKIISPFMSAAWISLVWAVRANNAPALFVVFAVMGACGVTMLPLTLELAVEQTGSADASCALLYFVSNVLTIIFTLVEPALKAGPNASPPHNMRNALILQAVIVGVLLIPLLTFKGEQTRRVEDEARAQLAKNPLPVYSSIPVVDVDANRSEDVLLHPQFTDPYDAA